MNRNVQPGGVCGSQSDPSQGNSISDPIGLDMTVRRLSSPDGAHRDDQRMDEPNVVQVHIESANPIGRGGNLFSQRDHRTHLRHGESLSARGKRCDTCVVRIARVLTAAVVAGGVAITTAGQASARPVDPPMYGVYTYHQDGAPDETWTIYATCVDAGCVLHPSSIVSPNLGPDSDLPGYGGDARKVNGLWTWALTMDKGMKCADGSWAPVSYSYAWDQATLAGTLTTFRQDGTCGMNASMSKQPFHLTYKEPLPIPINLDPLNQIENLP